MMPPDGPTRDPDATETASCAPQIPERLASATAEVQITGDRLHVTIETAGVPDHDLDWFVGSNLVLVWSRADPERDCALVNLPVTVDRSAVAVRLTNGVFDLTARTDASQTHPDDETREAGL